MEYLIRLDVVERQVGFSAHPIGLTKEGQFVTQQRFVAGDKPTQAEVDDFLSSKGLAAVRQNCWLWKSTIEDGLEPWIGDARAENFVKTTQGLLPIDVRMWLVGEGEQA